MSYPVTLDEAFIRHAPQEGDGCWRWSGNLRKGYGRVVFRGQQHYAHRYAYERTIGAIPSGMTVDHLCHNADPACSGGSACSHRSCVNPAHLGLATSIDNANRAARIGRTGRCGKGHAVSGENVYVIRGLPNCRACHLDRQRAYESRRNHKDDIRAGGDGVVWTGVIQ